MANTTFTKTLSLMAYENNLTPDIADDYTLRVPPRQVHTLILRLSHIGAQNGLTVILSLHNNV